MVNTTEIPFELEAWTLWNEGTPASFQWSPGYEKAIYASILGLLLCGTNTVKGLFIQYLIFHGPLDRPVNVHIVIEQIFLFILYTVSYGSVLVSIIASTPISNFFGSYGPSVCTAFVAISLPPFKLFLSFGLALYRLLFLQHTEIVSRLGGRFSVLWILLGMEVVLAVASSATLTIGSFLSKFSLSKEFCMGQGRELSLTLFAYEGGTEDTAKRGGFFLVLGLAMSIVLISIEFVIYRKVFSGLDNHDKAMLKRGVINKTTFRTRHKTNVITLKGQRIIFFLSAFVIVVGTISTAAILRSSFYYLVIWRISGILIVSLCELLTSNDMRRHLNINYLTPKVQPE